MTFSGHKQFTFIFLFLHRQLRFILDLIRVFYFLYDVEYTRVKTHRQNPVFYLFLKRPFWVKVIEHYIFFADGFL
jgi:hypothetical protein